MEQATAEEKTVRTKLTARIHLRAQQPHTPKARAVTEVSDAAACPAMSPLTEAEAVEVAQHIQGRRGKAAGAYLAQFARQQEARGETALTRLVDGMIRPPEETHGGARLGEALPDAARQATEAWLLSGYLIHHRQAAAAGAEPALIDGLEDNVNRVLGRLGPQALLALHGRLAADEAPSAPPGTRMFSRQMDAVVDAVGLLAVRNAWAASTLCEQVGAPLTFDQLCRIAYDATAISGSKADITSTTQVIKNLAPLAIERFQYLLVQFLRIRAAEILRDKGIAINELVGIARTGLTEPEYAATIAGALQAALTPVPPPVDGGTVQHPSDDKVRPRLNALLGQFSEPELRAAAAGLAIGDADFATHARSLKRQVESHGVDAAGRAALGRHFTILCAMVARELAERFPQQPGPLSVAGLREWQWDDRFSLDMPIPTPPTRLRRATHAVSRGVRRAFFSVFHSYGEDERRLRDAYAGLVESASRFVRTAGANPSPDLEAQAAGAAPRAFDKSAARLVRAVRRCQTLCRTPGGDIARTRLQIPTDAPRLLDAAFRDALGLTPGAQVDALGRRFAKGLSSTVPSLSGASATGASTPGASTTGASATGASAIGASATGAASAGASSSEPLSTEPSMGGPSATASSMGAPHLVSRLSAYLKRVWRPSISHADAQLLVGRLQVAVNEEAGIRAATEIVRALDHHFTAAQTHPAPLESASDEASTPARVLMDIRTLEQRFRPLDSTCFPQAAVSGMDWPRLLELGLKRLPTAQRERLRDAICDLDRPRPVWLTQDELCLAVVRCFQGRGGLL